MSTPATASHDMAAKLAARVCHDLIGPVDGLKQGLALLADPAMRDMRKDAMDLVADSSRRLEASLTFARAAFGSASDAVSVASLRSLVEDLFAGHRARLMWQVDEAELPGPASRALLNFSQMALAALPYGGQAQVAAARPEAGVAVSVTATDPRLKLPEAALRGLAGEAQGEGLAGLWVQGAFLRAAVTSSGGTVGAEAAPEMLSLWAAWA